MNLYIHCCCCRYYCLMILLLPLLTSSKFLAVQYTNGEFALSKSVFYSCESLNASHDSASSTADTQCLFLLHHLHVLVLMDKSQIILCTFLMFFTYIIHLTMNMTIHTSILITFEFIFETQLTLERNAMAWLKKFN
jgi:hypothetical protein